MSKAAKCARLSGACRSAGNLCASVAAVQLRWIVSFLGLRERALGAERACTDLRDASRHPASFDGALVNLDELGRTDQDGWNLPRFVHTHSSPSMGLPIRAVAVSRYDQEDDEE